ncbi:hypothetical protein J2X58_002793 [Luteibacter sp. 3190]|nr:hypothetical protein [Luteibacter sp. 3190]
MRMMRATTRRHRLKYRPSLKAYSTLTSYARSRMLIVTSGWTKRVADQIHH